ncbi:DUF6326 family protein [Jannaschia seohaensis]|uniref:Uncharacterized protein n=1 Tax=Jannaschia seohaensis TaxID=475081 RepID=A0A2Y9BV61_9RHOB|nr:DUF6326 family protein [Jannaschia seohaensis]PWJ21600.1 hypothetical protein BCF38_1015 [Jannaschia seohaensis]SSA36802.1 hypothetical protein SAMN05421539_1015 [Jannaschia seohaensis]
MLLSLLWVFVSLNIVFADVLSIYTPGVLPQVMEGVVEGVALSETLMLIAAVFIQIPLAMIVLTHLLPPRGLKLVTTVAALVTAAFVIGGGSLKPHYIFFASCEVLALLTILRQTWRRDA